MSANYLPAWIWALVVAPFAGSFVGVLALRLPAARPVVWARSECPQCTHRLSAVELVPLVSWLAQSGRCRHCAAPVGILYPAIELSAIAVAVWAVLTLPGPLLVWSGCLLGWTLLGAALADARYFVLPDVLVLPLIPAGILLHAWIGGDWVGNQLVGAIVGYVIFAAVAVLYRRLRGRDGLGLGDANLLAAAGAWVGWTGLPSVVFLGAVFGLMTAAILQAAGRPVGRVTELPFGPGLALAFWLVWLYGPLVA